MVRSVVNSNVFHAFAWSKGGNVVNSNVCVFLHGRREDMSKSVMFLCVLHGRREDMSKSVVFVESVVFLCVLGVKSPTGAP